MKQLLPLAGIVFLVACSSPAPESTVAGEFKNLIGTMGRDGETALKQAGYEHRNTTKTESSSVAHWRGKESKCIEVTTADGRYTKIEPVAGTLCDDTNAAVAVSNNPNALRTVCGVIVGGKTTRYLCEVEENRQGTTKLKMPDTNIELVWGKGKAVTFKQEGTTPIEAKFTESEGEMDIIVDQRTFFYIANPQAAALEVKNFKP